MKILAIDTSMLSEGIALLEDNMLIAESINYLKRTHAERLLPSIKNLLDNIGIKIEEIDCFALTNGPGSFTGLRIGISAIKGIAWGLNKPVIGISTLSALVMNIPYSEKPICPILDARKKEVYAAIYKFQDTNENLETYNLQHAICLIPDTAITPDALIEKIKEPTIFIGDGIKVYGEFIKSVLKDMAIFTPPNLWPIMASNVGLLAWEKLKNGNVDSPLTIKLNYLRQSEAELKLNSICHV